MILKFNVKEQTISLVNTKSVPRIGSKDYLVLQFSFSSDWENLDKFVYLQSGDISQPINIVDNLVEVPEWFTEQNSFNVTLFGTDGTTEVPTNVVSVQLEKSNDLWVKDAPEPTPSWIAELIDLSNHPPIPGSNGYWLLWDTDMNKYTESQLPLPEQVQPDWNQNDDTQPDYIKNKPLIVISFKPAGKSYLTFSSSSSFTLAVNDATKHWDGTLEYFASDKTWTVWDGTTTLSAIADDGEYVLYLRGTGNTVITGSSSNYKWVLTGSDIACVGNIENILDYATLESGNHPTMAKFCYYYMFDGCTALTQAPDLPATTLEYNCYAYMFRGCTSLIQAPALPATTLASYCYYCMFSGCTSLTQAPDLLATTLANGCYNTMFSSCTSLIQAPALPATTLERDCYALMFYRCTSLTQAPALPATTLEWDCYTSMFSGCTSLTKVPALPATTLERDCYRLMFRDCTSLKLSSTQTDEYTQEYRIPSSGAGTTATTALKDMFTSTGGTFTGTPNINTTYYLSSDNMIVRETEIATLNGYVESMIDVAIAEHTYNPLNITGATVGQIAKITAVDDTGKPTAWETVDMPDKLPNPNALTFTGAVTGSYDGSAPLEVEIPSGGGSGGAENWRLVNTVTAAEDVSNIMITQDSDGNPLSLKRVKIFAKVRGNSASLSTWCRITVNNLTNNFYCDLQNTFAAKEGQDNYNYARADFAIYAGRLMLELLLRSANNAASKNTLWWVSNSGCFENYPDVVDAITSIRMWSASAGIGAGTELMIYGVDA